MRNKIKPASYNIKLVLQLLLFGVSTIFNSIVAQDLHLSQYDATPQYQNPAMTGLFDGDYRANIHFRNQWSMLATKPFRTTSISLDAPLEKFNGGVYILHNSAGAGNYNVLNLIFSGAKDFQIPNYKDHHLAIGIQLGLIHKSVDMNSLLFSSQYSNTDGGGFNGNTGNGEVFSNSSIVMPESNLGLLYYFGGDKSRLNPFFGVSVFHLTEPRETFFGADNRLPRRYLIHGGAKYNVSKRIQVSGYLLAMAQVNDREFTQGLFAHYHMKNSDTYIMYGVSNRMRDAAMIHLGIKHQDILYRLSYDVNTSALNAITNGQGGFELSISYVMRSFNANPLTSCPRL